MDYLSFSKPLKSYLLSHYNVELDSFPIYNLVYWVVAFASQAILPTSLETLWEPELELFGFTCSGEAVICGRHPKITVG